MSRSRPLALLLAGVLVCTFFPSKWMPSASAQDDAKLAASGSFGFEAVVARAKAAAESEFAPPSEELPEALAKLGYDGYRDIRYRAEAALFHADDSTFEVQFFHRGFLFKAPVTVHLVTSGAVADVPYQPSAFEFGPHSELRGTELPANLGFAGLRVLCPLNQKEHKDELVAFLGASYFRMLSRGQVYGISARGLAIDTAGPNGEEFPSFREFWIESPTAESCRIHALLDSPSVAGAYEFTFVPGAPTIARVRVAIFARKKVAKMGIAPMTSMFLFGKDRVRLFSDYRPEVHDSDGLLIASGDSDWSFRALSNPPRVHRISRFDAKALKGFGLLQREREFRDYQDIESRFEQRPSLWVVPESGFDDGFVELVEIPTEDEIHDNIVAYFVPRRAIEQGDRVDFAYTLTAPSGDPARDDAPRYVVESTRVHVRAKGEPTLFVVEFASTNAADSTDAADGADTALPTAQVKSATGEIRNPVVQRNPVTQAVRVSFEFVGDEESVDLTLRLLQDGANVSEAWLYSLRSP